MVRRTTCPVTVKIRSGWDRNSINASEVALALEGAGAAAITVHPRCRSERHRGKAAWSVIADVKKTVSIPIIGNGDVHGPDSANQMFKETGVDGIMVGRGALMNPWIFQQIVNHDCTPKNAYDYEYLFATFIERLRDYLPEKLVLNRLKAFIGWATKGLYKGHSLRRNIYAAKSLPEVCSIFNLHFTNIKLFEETR